MLKNLVNQFCAKDLNTNYICSELKIKTLKDLIYYQDSGSKTANSVLICLLILFFANIIPATGYALFLGYFPVIYINFVVLISLLFITAFLAKVSVKLCKIRDFKTKLILAGISGLFAYYFTFLSTDYFIYRNQKDIFTFLTFETLSFPISTIINDAIYIKSHGGWNINGLPINGTLLVIIWVLEFLLFISAPIYYIFILEKSPFSEATNTWYTKYVINHDFEYIGAQKIFTTDLTENRLQAIYNLKHGTGKRFSHINIFYLPNDDIAYMSIINKVRRKEDTSYTQDFPVLQLVQISAKEAEELINKYRKTKAFYFSY